MKRASIHADADGLALITAAAARRGIPAAEIIREGIHLAAPVPGVGRAPDR